MDGNGNSNRRLKIQRWRHKNSESYRRSISQFFKAHKRSLLTGVLLMVIVILLFGIASLLQAPTTNTSPGGVTVLSYSDFVEQVKAGNVLAVTFQGKDIHALLASPFSP